MCPYNAYTDESHACCHLVTSGCGYTSNGVQSGASCTSRRWSRLNQTSWLKRTVTRTSLRLSIVSTVCCSFHVGGVWHKLCDSRLIWHYLCAHCRAHWDSLQFFVNTDVYLSIQYYLQVCAANVVGLYTTNLTYSCSGRTILFQQPMHIGLKLADSLNQLYYAWRYRPMGFQKSYRNKIQRKRLGEESDKICKISGFK